MLKKNCDFGNNIRQLVSLIFIKCGKVDKLQNKTTKKTNLTYVLYHFENNRSGSERVKAVHDISWLLPDGC